MKLEFGLNNVYINYVVVVVGADRIFIDLGQRISVPNQRRVVGSPTRVRALAWVILLHSYDDT